MTFTDLNSTKEICTFEICDTPSTFQSPICPKLPRGNTNVMSLFSGHIAALSSVAWNPKNASQFISASADSTIRLWDLTDKRKSKAVIVVKSKERGGRTKVSACAWSLDGKTIGGGESFLSLFAFFFF